MYHTNNHNHNNNNNMSPLDLNSLSSAGISGIGEEENEGILGNNTHTGVDFSLGETSSIMTMGGLPPFPDIDASSPWAEVQSQSSQLFDSDKKTD